MGTSGFQGENYINMRASGYNGISNKNSKIRPYFSLLTSFTICSSHSKMTVSFLSINRLNTPFAWIRQSNSSEIVTQSAVIGHQRDNAVNITNFLVIIVFMYTCFLFLKMLY
jgi:hypothetical protein